MPFSFFCTLIATITTTPADTTAMCTSGMRAKLSITEYLELSANPDDPLYQKAFQKRRAGKAGWHGFKLLHNPLCAEFGIRTVEELEDFIRDDLSDFAMVRNTKC